MGRRHALNSTAGTVYTYAERQKASKASGYGSKNERLGKDSIKNFDCCSLTLQPCQDPVVTPDGYLFDKMAVLEYILHQKKLIKRKLKEFEKQKNKDKRELEEIGAAEQEARVKKFIEKEEAIISKPIDPFNKTKASTSASISNIEGAKAKALPSFWIPALTPKAEATVVKKPDEKVRCPMSGKVIKAKDLLPIKFDGIQDRDTKTATIVKDARYVCAVTNDVLSNSIPCVVLRTSGRVVTADCAEKLVKKDMLDPFNGTVMTEKDFIPLQRGATGFSGSGVTLQAKKAGAVLMV